MLKSKTFKKNDETFIDQLQFNLRIFLYYIEGIRLKEDSINLESDSINIQHRTIKVAYSVNGLDKHAKINYENYSNYLIFTFKESW